MFFLRRPTDERIQQILLGLADQPFTHPHLESTRHNLNAAPDGFVLDRYGTELGRGDAVFEAACQALADFENYPKSFTRVVRASPTLKEGLVFGTVASHFGFSSVHPCRVAYLLNDESPRRFGFALGTLPGHIGAGEERFTISQAEPGGVVRYDVQAISRPAGWFGRLTAPVFRLFQKRFQEESMSQMRSRCEALATAIESR